MKIGYDPGKNHWNITHRALPFDDVAFLDWTRAVTYPDQRHDYGEPRYIALAPLDNRLHVVCFTWRNDVLWVISFRKANKREEKIYAQKTTH